MIFLIHYDPVSGGRLIKLQEFDSSMREVAAAERLKIEVELLATGSRMEVVTLEAESLAELQKTHSRYFLSIGEMADSAKKDEVERVSVPQDKNRKN